MKNLLLIIGLFVTVPVQAVQFELTPLGVYGGAVDGNLSSYLLRNADSNNYISLDSGTLVNGLLNKAVMPEFSSVASKLKYIKAYLISHAHFDHAMGFIIAAPELKNQPVLMARQETLQTLTTLVFNWAVWGNFGDSGQLPHLNFHKYRSLPLNQWQSIDGVEQLQVKTFDLNHGNDYPSGAFLVRNEDQRHVLYLGDVGADAINQDNKLKALWQEVAPLVRNKQLDALLMECSYPEEQADTQLFGHLKPSLFLDELTTLARLVDPDDSANALANISIFVTHVKPNLTQSPENFRKVIFDQLKQQALERGLRLKFMLPEQGATYLL